MENKLFGRKLKNRTVNFAISIIKLSTKLPDSAKAIVVKRQINKSGTSVGANYNEANRARSKADFRNKINISVSEANEKNYWLKIIYRMHWLSKNIIDPAYSECNELLALFTTIATNCR